MQRANDLGPTDAIYFEGIQQRLRAVSPINTLVLRPRSAPRWLFEVSGAPKPRPHQRPDRGILSHARTSPDASSSGTEQPNKANRNNNHCIVASRTSDTACAPCLRDSASQNGFYFTWMSRSRPSARARPRVEGLRVALVGKGVPSSTLSRPWRSRSSGVILTSSGSASPQPLQRRLQLVWKFLLLERPSGPSVIRRIQLPPSPTPRFGRTMPDGPRAFVTQNHLFAHAKLPSESAPPLRPTSHQSASCGLCGR